MFQLIHHFINLSEKELKVEAFFDLKTISIFIKTMIAFFTIIYIMYCAVVYMECQKLKNKREELLANDKEFKYV